ncbi:hypothetical protein [Clostridium sardiniense]|uniref:hypothetical protein n=1 Tax=Clostridium sardiniense TaxID=29369 RepID=UPI001956F8A9|nr:hypothetical protein [Clostridium sardiniense]MBM7835826.1 hypothetical protein [Clostridium sardiniense]
MKREYKNQGLNFINYYNNVDHYGGVKDLGFIAGGSVYLFEDRVRVYGEDIFIKDIEYCRVKTETELFELISLSKVIAFIKLASSLKKKEKRTRHYILIKCKLKGEITRLDLSFKDENEDFVRRINELINQKKIDEELANSIRLYNYGE